MSKKWVYLMSVLVILMGGGAFGVNAYVGFNSGEDGAYYTLDDPNGLNGQGTDAGDWEGPWLSSPADPNGFKIVAGGDEGVAGDQCLSMHNVSSTENIVRRMDPWTGDFRFYFSVRANIPTVGTGGDLQATQQISFTADRTDNVALSIKWEPSGLLRMNEMSMMLNYTAPTAGFLPMTSDNWVRLMVNCDWDAAGGPVFDLYWEKMDGTMGYVGRKVGFRTPNYAGDVTRMVISGPRVNPETGHGFDYDAIYLTVCNKGDIDPYFDCEVNLNDFAVLAEQWLQCAWDDGDKNSPCPSGTF